ncbi:MAG TPA: sulfotransferase [Mycobacteriales bacterium]|nr:sulfotransferase [Mycobacteriales bacterium]
MAAGDSQGPIFIVGSNGSGSTLLRLMLDSHERIAIPEETGFLRLAAMHRWVPYWKLGGDWYGNLGLTEDQIFGELAGFYGGLFTSYAASRGKQRWGDKTPLHVWHLELASRMFPDALVVGIVRHPLGTAQSLRRRFRRPIKAGVTHWLRANRQLLHAGAQLGDRFVLLRYEDLVTAPEPLMRALLDRLGEPWSDAVLSHHQVQPSAESTGFTRTDRAVDTESLSDWEAHVTGTALKRAVARTGALAEFLGYDPHRGRPAAPLGDPLLGGTQLAARQRELGAAIDWTPPRVRVEDRELRPPTPRKRRRKPDLSEVRLRDVLQQRLSARLSPDRRRKVHQARRSRPLLDRLIGPR